MIKSDNPTWGRFVVPNLPHQYIQEYMTILGAYADCHLTTATPRFDPKEMTWCFPFMEIDDSFDHGEYEEWIEMVEQDMMDRYNLTEHHFSIC